MDLPAILFLFLRNFYRSSTATPVAIDMTVVVQDMLLCFLFTDLYGFAMKVHSQEEEDPSLDQDQDWEENGIIIVLFVQILEITSLCKIQKRVSRDTIYRPVRHRLGTK